MPHDPLTALKHQAQDGVAELSITCTAAGATTLTAYQRKVRATPPSSGTHTITLPSPAVAEGGPPFDIDSIGNDTGTITISGEGINDIELTTTNDYAVLISNGRKWRVLCSQAT